VAAGLVLVVVLLVTWGRRRGADFGDVPGWVAAIGGVAAFAVALAVLFREVEGQRIDTEERIRRQARLVSCWLEVVRENPGGKAPDREVIIRNNSDEPIQAVVVTHDPLPPEGWWTLEVETIGAGPTQEARQWLESPDLDDPRPVLHFTDAAGIRWQRDRDGILSRERESS
jgi:hypothetical protein